jgi:hypothetical protein
MDDLEESDLPSMPPDQLEAVHARELRREVRRAVNRLLPRERLVLLQRYWLGRTLAATGEALGRSGARVRQIQIMAERRLRSDRDLYRFHGAAIDAVNRLDLEGFVRRLAAARRGLCVNRHCYHVAPRGELCDCCKSAGHILAEWWEAVCSREWRPLRRTLPPSLCDHPEAGRGLAKGSPARHPQRFPQCE